MVDVVVARAAGEGFQLRIEEPIFEADLSPETLRLPLTSQARAAAS
jgi:hypothetical protein